MTYSPNLLASHCFQDKGQPERLSPHLVLASLGSYNLSETNEVESKKTQVWQIILHPNWNFNDEKFDFDISIAVLYEEVRYSKSIQAIRFPEHSYREVEGYGFVVGWGKSENSGVKNYDETPSKILIPTVNASHCYTKFYLLGKASSVNHFCGGYENKAKAPCLGDSGGGFYSQDPWTLKGIVSASIIHSVYGCDINKFQLYTNVARFSDWIKEKISETSEHNWKLVDFECKEDDSGM